MPRRQQPLPSHGFLILNTITNWLAGLLLLLLFVFVLVVYAITYSIQRDCHNTYKRDIKLFGYWIDVESGSTAKECPQQ